MTTASNDSTLFYLVDPHRTAGDRSVGMDKDDVATLIGAGGGGGGSTYREGANSNGLRCGW